MKLRGRFITLWKAVRTVLKRKRDQGIGRLVTLILPFTRQTVRSIHKVDARLLLLFELQKIVGDIHSSDGLLSGGTYYAETQVKLQKIVGDIHSSDCSPDEIPEPIRPEVKSGILLLSSRWALRSLMKLDFHINGKYPRHLKVLHSAHRSASDIYTNLKIHNKGTCQE